MKPKISVVITTFQRPQMLERAIKSVLNQTFKDWELIIIDDYSQDETSKICQKYTNKDSRIRYIRRDVNFGNHTQPKNQGIQNAQTDLIAFLDDDNEYRRDHLQVLYKYLGDNDIVYGDRWLVDKTGKGANTVGIHFDFNAPLLSKLNYIDTSDVLIRKECLEKVGGWDETLPKFADWNLWIRLTKSGCKFQRVPIIITDYYVHSGMNQLKHKTDVDSNTGVYLPTYFEPDSCKIWPDKTIFGERKKMKVAIFTLTMDRLEYTKRMYESMRKTAGYDFDWIIVDNGSKDGTPEWLVSPQKDKRTISEVLHKELEVSRNKNKNIPQNKIKISLTLNTEKGIIILNSENCGISKASNQALDQIGNKYDLIIKVDNDCLFLTDNWLADIVDLYERQQRIVVAPRVEGLRDSPGGVPRTQYYYIGNHFLGLAPHLGGICIAAPSKIYDKFRWEEDDFLHGEQDYVFSQYAISQRYMLVYMENAVVEHQDTTFGQEKKYPEYFREQKIRKQTKYQLK